MDKINRLQVRESGKPRAGNTTPSALFAKSTREGTAFQTLTLTRSAELTFLEYVEHARRDSGRERLRFNQRYNKKRSNKSTRLIITACQ